MSKFPGKKVLVIAVALLANGTSSYRDAINISKITLEKWNAKTIIISDNILQIKKLNPELSPIQVNNKKQFLKTLEDTVATYSKSHDILFTISAHGYNMYNKAEVDNRDEFIIVKGNKVFDHDIRKTFYKRMDTNCLSLCLIDTCHSGTMLDLPWCSTDGKTFKQVEQSGIKPKSFCISACSDNELAGEDISDYSSWGGKLTCCFLDYFNENYKNFDIVSFYNHVHTSFTNQRYQKSHPILSSTIKP